MPFIPCPETCRAEMFMVADGQKMENVFHFRDHVPFTVERLEDVSVLLQNWATTRWALVASEHCSVVGFKITSLQNATAPVYEPTIGEAIPGLVAQDMLPLNVAAVVSWKTALRGRSYRGRTYHTGIPVTFVSGSLLLPVVQGSLVTEYSALLAAAISNDFQMVVCSLIHDNAVRLEGVATEIISLAVDAPLDSQRRRLPGRGA